MALAVEILPRRLACLLPEFLLLPLDPAKLRDYEHANCFQAHPPWSSDTDSSGRWVDTEVDIFDVLEYDIRRDFPEIELRYHQYSLCALMTRKMRSTSAASCKTSYRACFMICSRA